MDERTTNNNGEEEKQEAYASTEATDHQGMGADRQWDRSSREASEKHQIHPHTLYRWKKTLEQGAEVFLKGKRLKQDPKLKALEEENKRLKEALALQTQELMLLKKEMNLV